MTTGTSKTYNLPCDASLLVPHKPPMLLVGRLLKKAGDDNNDFSIVEATVPDSGPFIENDCVLPEYCIEIMAQAVAAIDGYRPNEDSSPATGFLVGIDSFTWSGYPKPGTHLQVKMQQILSLGSACVFSGSIIADSSTIAQGRLKIWKVDN